MRETGTPAACSAIEEAQTEPIDEEPFDSSVSETTRITYGNSSSSGIVGSERPLGERAVADVAALRAAHEAGLPHRERREVVVVPEPLGLLEAEVVDLHVHAGRAERDAGEDLRLAAREQRRAVDARRDVDLGLDRPDLVLGAAVGALLVDGDPLADDVLLELGEGAP